MPTTQSQGGKRSTNESFGTIRCASSFHCHRYSTYPWSRSRTAFTNSTNTWTPFASRYSETSVPSSSGR